MKTTFSIFFSFLLSVSLFAQINGNVSGENGESVEFATIYNITQITSCITDSHGKFQINGNIGDSIEIRHLSYKTKRFVINNQNERYTIFPELFLINEVLISAKEAAMLFEKCCRNTFNKFRDFDYTRGYCRYLRKNNQDTTFLIDLDLDIIHRKVRKFEKDFNILPIIVQERILADGLKFEDDVSYNIAGFYPHINAINWVKISNDFSYYKSEDSLFINLYFIADKHIWDLPYNYEVKIFKADSCLSSIAMSNRNNSTITNIYSYIGSNKGSFDTVAVIQCRSNYVEYKYENGYSFLSGFSHQFELISSDSLPDSVFIDVTFKTYASDAGKDQRRFGYRIFENKLKPDEIQNRYKHNFWESSDYIKTPLVDYGRILHLKIDE
ncbi:MAG: hypothetical protein AB7S72_04080 [Draconibacterium sp.]